MKDVFGYVDRNFDRFVEELAELIRIPSVSSQKRGLEECARHIVRRLQEVGLHAESIPMGGPDNPPLVYGRLDVPRAKRTLFIYGHFDVQPPEPLEAWETPPCPGPPNLRSSNSADLHPLPLSLQAVLGHKTRESFAEKNNPVLPQRNTFPTVDSTPAPTRFVKGGLKVYRRGGAIVYHRV